MYYFTQNKATQLSITKRRPVYGIGINDVDYLTKPTVNGKKLTCPIYQKWRDMIGRCYSEKHQTCTECHVCWEWLLFSNFREWVVGQEWQGLWLSKSIIVKGNNTYSPSTCLFVPRALNNLIYDKSATRGKYPIGVRRDNFVARIYINGSRKHLGCFNTPEEAGAAYQQARRKKLQKLIDDNTYPMATQYLAQHI